MEKNVKFLATLLLLAATCLGQAPTDKPKDTRMNDFQWRAFVATVQTEQTVTRIGFPEDTIECTGVFIGPQAILTATHCELPTDDLDLVDTGSTKILKRERDGADHTIYFIDTDFKLKWTPVNQNHIQFSEHIFTWHNPGEFVSIYSEGYFCGVKVHMSQTVLGEIPDGVVTLYDIQMYHGSSGSGIFRQDTGELVGIISASFDLEDEKSDNKLTYMHFAGAAPLNFEQKIIDEAVKFTTPQPKKEEKKEWEQQRLNFPTQVK